MPIKLLVFALISFFHDLFSAIWMGGLIVTVLAYLPAVKEALGAGAQVKKVMTAFQRRQSWWVYISMAGLILTGLLMSKRSPQFEGLFTFGNPYSSLLSIKHLLVVAMIGISLYRTLVLGKNPSGVTPEKERLNMQLLLVNAVLAVTVLLTSGFVAALAGR
ncbi:MAG: CopD family protein [Anaerolineales bacterium]